MEKGHELAARAVDWNFVNQLHARTGSLLKLARDVVRAEGDVMDAAIRIFLKKLSDGTFRTGRLQQLEVDTAHGKKRGADFLRGDLFATLAF